MATVSLEAPIILFRCITQSEVKVFWQHKYSAQRVSRTALQTGRTEERSCGSWRLQVN